MCSPQSSYVEVLTSIVAVFGDGASKEKLRLNEVIRVQYRSDGFSVLIRRDMKELAQNRSKTYFAGTLILEFPASRTVRSKFVLFNLPNLCMVLCYSSLSGLIYIL